MNSVEDFDLSASVLERVRRGFAERLIMANAAASVVSATAGKANIFDLVNSIQVDLSKSEGSHDHRSLQISAAISSPGFRSQHGIVSTVANGSDVGIVSALALGFLHNEHTVEFSEIWELPDVEFSRVIESSCRFRLNESMFSASVVEKIVEASKVFISSLLKAFGVKMTGLPSVGRPTTHDLLGTFVRFKRRSLVYAGPDIASVFQFIADPLQVPTEPEIHAMRELASDWRVEEVFDRVLFARLASVGPVERDYVRNNISRLVERRRSPTELSTDLMRIIGEGPSYPLSLRRRVSTHLHRQVYLQAKLASALDRGDKKNIYISVIDIFRFDRGLIKYLDWSRISREVRRSLDVTVESAFVTMLFNEPDVRIYHPRAAISMGKGAFIGDLTALLRSGGSQSGGFAKIFAQVRTLPTSAAQVMTAAILSRDIVERLAAALTPNVARHLSSLPSSDSTYISFLRVNAIKAAAKGNLMPPATVQTEIDTEIQQLRYNYFQNRMRIGRVRVPWDDIALSTKKVLDEFAPSGLLKVLAAREATDDVMRRLVQFITEKLTMHILYDGPVSIDHALSDNLRHGIVVPRFLKTFDDALQTTSQKHGLTGWQVEELNGIFSSHSGAILQYRDAVSDIIKAFVDTDLIVVVNGPLHRAVFDGIGEILEHYFISQGKSRSSKPETKVARLAQRLVRRALKTASRHLSDHVRRAIIQELNNVRSRCKHSGTGKTQEFLDCLETNLHEAIEEVRQWIGVADSGGDIIPFTLQEVVDLELLTTQFNALKRLKVKVEHEVFGGDERPVANYSIQGRFLAAFESIVHNLMSNAFKYSGAGLQTDMRLSVRLTPDRLFLRAENKITTDKIEDVIANFPKTLVFARKTIGPEVRQDKQSGFQKIRSAVSREFNAEPSINIPPPSMRMRMFVVEITIDLKETIWIET